MKKLLLALLFMSLFSSCVTQFGSRLGGYKAPRRTICIVGKRGAVWNY